MSEHQIFLCDGTRPADEVFQEAIDWVSKDPKNRKVTIQGKNSKTEIVQRFKESPPKEEG